jgi:spermidine synthase
MSALGLAFRVVGPALLAAGALLPAVLAAAGGSNGAPGTVLGRLLAVNTLGAIAGALLAPFVLLSQLTPFAACAAVAVMYAAVALFVPMPTRSMRLARDTVLGLGWVVLIGAANPLSLPLVKLAPGETLRRVDTSAAGVVAVIVRGHDMLLRTDNHQSLGGSADRVHQERQGWLAHLLHPTAKRVAWVGSATGISAGPFASASPLDELALVEITPGVAYNAARFFERWNRGVHQHPATRVVQDDARNFLRATSRRYDLIVADLFVPWVSGTGSLYTREHFDAVRARMNEGGVFVQWLPLYQLDDASFLSIVATFVDAFPCSSLWRGDFFGRFPIVALVGCTGRTPDPAEIAGAAEALRRGRATDDRWVTDPTAFFALYAGPLGPLKGALADVPRNTDDEPVVELASARSGVATGEGVAYTGSRLVTFVAALREAAARDGDDFFRKLPEPLRRASEAGELLQAASTAFGAGNTEAASALLRSASERLPDTVLDPNHPDPTAAEVWPSAK